MRRREFIGGLAGTATWPLGAQAQEPTVPVIGYFGASVPGVGATLAAFRKGLSEIGYFEGRNVAIEYRWAQNRQDQLRAQSADLVSRRVAVIVAVGGPASAVAAKSATATTPIIFANGSDPIALGLVESLNRPGGTSRA
jgi:putative tryptophan/tyrosine transport system substrate-binding protein